ncbi:amino acid permease [Flexivirga aerilata]
MSIDASQREHDKPAAPRDAGDSGYAKGLKSRHIQMIGIGGAIGTGLFLGAGGRLHDAGPSLIFSYAICGVFALFVVRALGEMVVHRPSSGAFVSYAREFVGEKGAYAAGWFHFLNWSTTVVADSTAIALYFHYWGFFSDNVPQWLIALVALVVVLVVNLVGVALFGELEFWFAIIKVAALVIFMLIAIGVIVSGHHVGGTAPGFSVISDNGGFFPQGAWPMFALMQGVVFAYASMELVGVAAGETPEPRKVMPKVVNSIIWRIAIFYIGSVVLLCMLLPYTSFGSGESPFVTVLSKLGVTGAGDVMNVVVITAAASSMNSGLYSTGRVLRSMSLAGTAPRFTGLMSKTHVPYGGIAATAAVGILGVVVNYLQPGKAFEIVLNLASVGIIGVWSMIMISHLMFVRKARRGEIERPGFRLGGAPVINIVTLVFLAAVLVLIGTDGDIGTWTICLALPLVAAAMVGGWFVVRGRIDSSVFDDEGSGVA